MDPRTLNQDAPKATDLATTLDQVIGYFSESRSFRRSALEPRWSRNQKIVKGIPVEEKNDKSPVTGRKKIYFRKVWSTCYRLLASFFQAFLQDKNKYKINGRDDQQDWMKAKVLEFMTKYHLYRLMRRNYAFVKLVWAFMNAISPGFSVIKLFWRYNKATGEDAPDFCTYPLEQTLLDWWKETPDAMEFAGFENYLTKGQMEDMDYENIDKMKPVSVPQSDLRHVRYHGTHDPASPSSGASEYSNGTVGASFPAPGTGGATTYDHPLSRYCIVEMFYKKKGVTYFCAFDPHSRIWAKKPEPSVYGTLIPIAVGSMLAEANKLVPEGLPEVLEGPAEALNLDINLRKDNVRLSMNGGFIYGKFGGVDKQALRNPGPGFIVGANDPNQVVPLKYPDVTANSHIEISQDVSMLEEMSGVNDTIQGQSSTGKTGEAQINFQNANVKLDFNSAMIGQTLFHQFIYILAYMIQRFETDENVFRVANQQLRASNDPRLPAEYRQGGPDIVDIEFDMDCEVEVGYSEVSRAVRAQRFMNFAQVMNQSNQATFAALSSGIKIDNPRYFNIGEAAVEFATDFGIDNPSRFLVAIAPPPPEPEAATTSTGEVNQRTQGDVPQPNAQPTPEDDGFAEFMKGAIGGLQPAG